MSNKTKYHFSSEIQNKLQGFKNYLKELCYKENTISQKLNYAGYFINWLELEYLKTEEIRYKDILNFIDFCKLEGKSRKLVNIILRAIRNYYEYLKRENPEIINPAINIKLRGIRKKAIRGIIEYKTLEKLYQNFKTKTIREKRNKVILGLLIYQGITTEELQILEPTHLRLKEGKIYIPGGIRRNSRILELKPFQVLQLYEYLTEIRPQIIAGITIPKPLRKPEKINKEKLKNQLFISIKGSENIKNTLVHLFKFIQKTHPEIKNPKQIRASVIVHWLKNYNLREVQYMAGHKYVSSTERYKLNNLDNLQSRIEKLHPLNEHI